MPGASTASRRRRKPSSSSRARAGSSAISKTRSRAWPASRSHRCCDPWARRSASRGAVRASARVRTRCIKARSRSPLSIATGRTGWASVAWAIWQALPLWPHPPCSATWPAHRRWGSSGIPSTSTFPYRQWPVVARARGSCPSVHLMTPRKPHRTAPRGNENSPRPKTRRAEGSARGRRSHLSRSLCNPVTLPPWTSMKVVARVQVGPSATGVRAKSEVIGSLLRPAYLAEARRRYEQAEITVPEFKRLEDRAVDEALETQTLAGIDVITDGEMRRYAFYGHLIDSLDGFDKFGGWGIEFRDEKGEKTRLRRPVVVEKLRWRHHMCVEEWTYLRAPPHHPARVTLISPQQAAAYYDPEKSRGAYPTRDASLADIVDFTRREIAELLRLRGNY